jgi:isopentenyldiphosphate isomerase
MIEEIGLHVTPEQLEFAEIKKFSQPIEYTDWYENEIGYIYFYKYDGNVGDLSMPDGEVEKLEFIPIDRFEKDINDIETSKKYVPYIPLGEYYSWVAKRIREKLNSPPDGEQFNLARYRVGF